MAEGRSLERTWLFVPGDRPDRFEKAAAAGADEVICDLEDAVSPQAKDEARTTVAQWLSAGGSAWVRINGRSTPWHDEDLAAVHSLPGLRGLVVPKAEVPAHLDGIGRRLTGDRPLLAIVETAGGLRNAFAIAECEAVRRLAFGSVDFALDVDSDESPTSLLLARSTLVLASRCAGKAPPIDGVTRTLDDPDASGRDAAHARALGFGGKLCVHPSQIGPVSAAFEPTPGEVDWARRVVALIDPDGAGAVSLDGQMIDRPLLERARRILSRSSPT